MRRWSVPSLSVMRAADTSGCPPTSDAAFEDAYATVLRGADFLADRLQRSAQPQRFCLPPTLYRAKMLGNALRELDRFLNLLADATGQVLGLPLSEGQRNTANKLRDIEPLCLVSRDYRRLQALGRSRECLFHLDGRVRSGDYPGNPTFTAGWPEDGDPAGSLRLVEVGDCLIPTGAELANVAAFYRRLASALGRAAGYREDDDECHRRRIVGTRI